MTVMSEATAAAGSEPVTLVNVFEVAAEDVDEFVALWRERAAVMSRAPGFRDAQMLRAIVSKSRFQLVNVAHWDSPQAWHAANVHPEFQGQLRALADQSGLDFAAHPALYRAAVTFGPDPVD